MSLVTQISLERLARLRRVAEAWTGPVSLAVFAPASPAGLDSTQDWRVSVSPPILRSSHADLMAGETE